MSRQRLSVCLCLWAFVAHAQPWSVSLTDADRAWIAAHPTIRVALADDSGPFSFIEADGSLAGISVDYLALFGAKTGLRFELQPRRGFAEAMESVKGGSSDVVMLIGKTEAREAVFRFTRPIAYSPDAIVTRSDAPFLFDTSQLAGRRVALASSSVASEESLRVSAPGVDVVFYETMGQAVEAVSRGEVFAAVTDASIAAFTAKQERLTNLRVGGIFQGTGDVHAAVRPDWPELVAILDEVLAAIPTAERAQITNRWVVLDYESDNRWRQAFSISAGVLALVAMILLVSIRDSRRRAAELAVRRRMQAELEAAHATLERMNRDKGELMRMLAHDLRNPLSTLSLNVDALDLMAQLPTEERKLMASEMRAGIKRMVDLIGTLLDLQAIEDGKRTFRFAPLELAGLAREAVGAMNDAAVIKNLSLRLDAAPALPPVESDANALRQVIDNLLSNAIKYSPTGTGVVVEVSGDAERQRVVVRDQGPGLTDDDRARLFHKYATGSARPTGGEKSTGLGLWIVQQIATGLHGAVRCDSEPGKGAAFTFEVPVRRAP